MNTAIVIPARFASTRLPGKPLVNISGQTILERVVRLAQIASKGLTQVNVVVATDNERIQQHCTELSVDCVMTPTSCLTGTDRVAAAIQQLPTPPDFILNMQGDAPFTPPALLRALITAFMAAPCDAITPVTQLSWAQLDTLRENKRTTPLSGTTAIFNPDTGNALWFSKTIIPAIRQESALRKESPLSPVYRHIGLYGYSRAMLEQFVSLPEGHFEALEGLEQLRLLEHGYRLRCVPVEMSDYPSLSGIDSPEDVIRAEQLIAEWGELCP
jgi:3-deoxy-manno-octulosonate cytidylyltransferase (CMP-KDO synthetase)